MAIQELKISFKNKEEQIKGDIDYDKRVVFILDSTEKQIGIFHLNLF